MEISRGDIYYADLSPVVGSEQGGVRPVLVVQNNVGNKYSPTVIIAAITSQLTKAKLPTHIELAKEESLLNKDSVVLLEQVRTLDKRRLKEKVSCLSENIMQRVDVAIMVSLGLFEEGHNIWFFNKNIFYKNKVCINIFLQNFFTLFLFCGIL